jgi:3'-phosphoadenosine 5'-phosphosulfate sulfotransferase (PAPS reductase)/FAD synthetase
MRLTKEQLNEYDTIIIAFSGGKDSTACLLDILDQGVDKDKIELWHHDIDGRSNTFMDWCITPSYCEKFAEDFGLKIYFSWKEGGFSREMLRNNTPTAPTFFETPTGIGKAGGQGKNNTRLKFPQVSANLSVRWCSAYLKIDVCSTAIRNQERFNGKKTLLVSGERAEESAGRAKYLEFEPDRADNRDGKKKRHVDRYRNVHKWTEQQVWDIIEKYKIRVHPAYYIGWGRVSCASCIFGSKDQWATLYKINKNHVDKIIHYENKFGVTINRTKSIPELIEEGIPYSNMDDDEVQLALSEDYNKQIFIDDWTLPAGAFGESCGPI